VTVTELIDRLKEFSPNDKVVVYHEIDFSQLCVVNRWPPLLESE
jgi:hypothetical protein